MKIAVTRSAATTQRLAADLAVAARQIASDARRAAYVNEADPIAFKLLRGEATPEEYAAKIAEIRARFPYEKEA